MKIKGEPKVNTFLSKNKMNIVISAIVLIIIVIIILYNTVFTAKKTYTLVNGYIEKMSYTLACVVKDEKIVELNKTDIAMPIIEQDKKVSKGEVMAVYKNDKYIQYLSSIDSMDKEIQSLVSDLPPVYSNDISQIDNQISNLSKEASKTTSYVKMHEYKNKIDELSYKKVNILGQLSPAGSKIRELIQKREELETTSKSSSDSIKAPNAGIVTYKTDKLEDVASINNILKYTPSDFDNIISKYSKNNNSDFGIKVVNNYLAYIVVREPRGQNDEFITVGNKYTIKLSDKTNVSLTGKILKNTKTDAYNYVVFELNNGIENLIDSRMINVQVVWKKYSGMAVPSEAVHKSETGNYEYVTIINGSDYIQVPITVKSYSDTIYIVDNMSKEKIAELGITSKGKLELYDQIVMEK